MEENEGKDLAQDMKKELLETEKYYENVKLELNKVILNDVTIGEKHQKELAEDGTDRETVIYNVYINFKDEDVLIATIDESGKLEPNRDILNNEKYTEEDKAALGDMLNRLGLEQDEINMDKLQEQLKTIEAKTKEELEQSRKGREDEEIKDEEQEPEEEQEEGQEEQSQEESQKDEEIKNIAKKYNVSSKDVIKLNTRGEKLTQNENFSELVQWAEGREDVYVIADKRGSIKGVVEKKGDEYEEVEHNMEQVQGNNPTVKIHLVGNDNIRTIIPLKIYEIDSDTALATVRNEWGELETIYCRRQQGEQEYFGEKVPEEHTGKNRRQLDFDERTFMDEKYTSPKDLERKADELEKANDHDKRGVPSEEEGVQVEEINGTRDQNREQEKEQIKKDLYNRMGITEQMKANLMPGQLEYLEAKIDKQAEDIQLLMEEDKDISYEEAVEETKPEGERGEGGRTPGEPRDKRNE